MLTPDHAPTLAPLSPKEIDQILFIQSACYREGLVESRESLLAKVSVTPDTCFGMYKDNKLCAYLITLPCHGATPPALNSSDYTVPADADSIYIHDLSVLPEARKFGVGKTLINAALEHAKKLGLESSCLVAVQDSKNYWARYGYEEVREISTELKGKLSSYGEDAVFMSMPLTPRAEGPWPAGVSLPQL